MVFLDGRPMPQIPDRHQSLEPHNSYAIAASLLNLRKTLRILVGRIAKIIIKCLQWLRQILKHRS